MTRADIVHFQRRPVANYFSVERIFEDVRARLAALDLPVRLRVNRHFSRGVFGRLADAVGAALEQGAVNHVTGDVHYLTYFLRRDRTVLTVLDCVGLARFSGLKRRVFRFLWYTVPTRRARYITVISEFTRRELIRETGVAADRITVIPPPLSHEFAFVPKAFDDECPRILQVGATPNKNIERLARALAGLRCRLVVVGRMEDSQRESLADARIDFENPVGIDRDALLSEYERADIVAFASTYEGFGMPIVEANAVGRPVVAGNVCSMPEVAGDAACLVDPFDVASIRAGFERVIRDADYRANLVANGRANAKRFALDEIAGRYLALYRQVPSAHAVRNGRAAWPRDAH